MGRKRQVLVDTQGLLVATLVHEADLPDSDGGRLLVERHPTSFPRLCHLWVDKAYRGFADWASAKQGWSVEVVTKAPEQKGFVVQPRRWVVERSLAWLGHSRRLRRDYEHYPTSTEGFIYISSVQMLLKRLHFTPNLL
jgi:putative transposase